MPFFSTLSTSADSSEAVAAVLAEAASFGRVDLAMVFYSRQHIEHIARIGRTIADTLAPRVVLGCLGESIVSNEREIENTPALSLWLGHWPEGIDIDQSFGNNNARNTNALFHMIDRNAVKVEFPTASDIASEGSVSLMRTRLWLTH